MSERTRDGLAAARARGRTGGQKPTLGPRQVQLAQQMDEELDNRGKRRYTVDQIAAEFGVTRPTIYRHLNKTTPQPPCPRLDFWRVAGGAHLAMLPPHTRGRAISVICSTPGSYGFPTVAGSSNGCPDRLGGPTARWAETQKPAGNRTGRPVSRGSPAGPVSVTDGAASTWSSIRSGGFVHA
ncbi:hypothetical protein [Nocardia sp. NPDC046763]|uniref:hypothetical protein n=1 Tax=Nocardia sp. NPDC046763 TaxID=3155256 RepID=UPI0033C5E917